MPSHSKLIPRPRGFEPRWGRLDLAAGIRLEPAPGTPRSALLERFQARFDRRLGSRVRDAARVPAQFRVETGTAGAHPNLGDNEDYTLRISSTGATLEAATPWGAAHGLERCLQLVELDAGGPFLSALVLDDGPQLPWRGLLLDIVRHFFDLPVLLRTLDGMAAAGLNVLHLHLNDDQAYRLESRFAPRLNKCAARDGFLGREDVGRLVEAAAERGIRIVPELDVPGHAGALLWAYPELAAGPVPDALPRGFGPSRYALDPSLPATWDLLEGLVDELVELFPDRYVHLGGDEVHPAVYAFPDDRRRAWMQDEGIADAAAVQAWFTRRMAELLAARGRQAVGWDEVLHPQMPERLTVHSWRGAATLEGALAAGHDALFSAGYYLDLCYPARFHYAFDPAAGIDDLVVAETRLRDEPELLDVSAGIKALHDGAAASAANLPRSGARGRLLGGEACMWTELVDPNNLDSRLYGRLAAVAERLWSPAPLADVNDFESRLPDWLVHLEAVTDCRPLSVDPAHYWRLGVRPVELPHVQALFEALEPVRWYRRLLGEQGLRQRAEGVPPDRPYDADTPLNRPVDLLPPESVGMRQLAVALAGLSADRGAETEALVLRDYAGRWRMLPVALRDLCRRSDEMWALEPHVDHLLELSDMLDELVDALLVGERAGLALRLRFAELFRLAGGAVAETRLAAFEPLAAHLGPAP